MGLKETVKKKYPNATNIREWRWRDIDGIDFMDGDTWRELTERQYEDKDSRRK